MFFPLFSDTPYAARGRGLRDTWVPPFIAAARLLSEGGSDHPAFSDITSGLMRLYGLHYFPVGLRYLKMDHMGADGHPGVSIIIAVRRRPLQSDYDLLGFFTARADEIAGQIRQRSLYLYRIRDARTQTRKTLCDLLNLPESRVDRIEKRMDFMLEKLNQNLALYGGRCALSISFDGSHAVSKNRWSDL